MYHFTSVFHCSHFYSQFNQKFQKRRPTKRPLVDELLLQISSPVHISYGENMEGIMLHESLNLKLIIEMNLKVVQIIVFRFTVINNMGWICMPGTPCAWICSSPSSPCTIRFLNTAKSAESTQAPAQPPLIIAHFAIYSHTLRWLVFASKLPLTLWTFLLPPKGFLRSLNKDVLHVSTFSPQKSPSTPKFRFLSGLIWMGLLE